MGMINRIPQGFLNLLGSQTLGENPSSASNVVQPIIAMDPFYYADRLSIHQLGTLPVAVGQITSFSVPPEESWMLYAISISFTIITSADFSYHTISLRSLPNNPVTVGTMSIFNTGKMIGTDIVTPNQTHASVTYPVPIPLQAGAEFVWRLESTNAFRFTTLSLLIARLG